MTFAYNPWMGTTGDHRAEGGDADPDAPWRPGSEAPPSILDAEQSVPPDLATPPTALAEQHDAGPDPWSRAGAERALDWVAELRRRRPPRRTTSTPIVELPSVAAVDGLPVSTVSGEVGLVAVAVLAILVAASIVVGGLVGGLVQSSDASGVGAVVLPRQAEQLWTSVVDSHVDQVEVSATAVLLLTSTELVASDLTTGEQLWSRPLSDSALRRGLFVIDTTVALVETLADGTTTTSAVDQQTGTLLWSRSGSGQILGATDRWLYEFSETESGDRLVPRDPSTGERAVEELTVLSVDLDGPTPCVVEIADDGRLVVRKLESEQPGGVRVDSYEIRELASVGDSLVGFDAEATIIAFDQHGERSDERPFVSNAFGDFVNRAELVGGVPGHNVGIVSSGTSIGFEILDGQIELLWELAGRVGRPVLTEIGPVSVARLVDQTTGEIDMALIDPIDGTVMIITDVGETREADPVVAVNGFLIAPAAGSAIRELSAVGFDGAPWWSVMIPRFGSYVVDEQTVVVIERIGGRSAVTAYG